MKRFIAPLLAGLISLAALPAQAGVVFGVFGGNANAAVTASGNTAQTLSNLNAASLTGIKVLWIFNPSNSGISSTVTSNAAAISAFVQDGGVVAFHDRWVTGAASFVTGASGVSFVRSLGSDINAQANNLVTNGPAGIVNNTNLDGGNFSAHGYANVGSLPAGAVTVLSEGSNANRAVDFHFSFGKGDVYYSSIPLDFYLNNANPAAFRDIYAVNEAAFLAQLRAGNEVSEPGALALAGLGLVGMVLVRRRRQAA